VSGGTSLTFPKARRLNRGSEIERVKQNGSAQRGKLLILGVLEVGSARCADSRKLSGQRDVPTFRGQRGVAGQREKPFRAGFITSRKIGGAVVRNRVRRRLREIVRKHQHDIGEGFWIVLIARPAAARATYSALEDEWLRLATRASILAP
jgi:ribonuclease P protein component